MGFGLDAAASGPLAELSVVEIGDGTAGPYAAKLLADFGAEVVKIESPEGDSSRRRGPFPDGRPDPEASGLFHYLNTNKFGVSLDLADKAGQAAVGRLLAKTDILISNLPLDRLQALGLAPEALRKRYPKLVITTISPFGNTGPWAGRKGDELTAYAASGLAYSTPGMPDACEDPERDAPLHPSAFVAETLAAIAGAIATMSAVLGVDDGCHIDVSEQGTIACMQIRDIPPVAYLGQPYVRVMNPITIGRMPNFYLPCKDGYVTVAAPMEIHWERLVAAMGSPAWAFTPEYSTTQARIDNWIELRVKIIEWTMSCSGDEIMAVADKNQLPMFAYHSIKRMAETDHARARESLVEVTIGDRPARMPGAPIKMRGTPWELRRPAPRLGEHNAIVLGARNEVAS